MKGNRRLLVMGVILGVIVGLLIFKFAVPRANGPAQLAAQPEKVAEQSSSELQRLTVPSENSNSQNGSSGAQTDQKEGNGQTTANTKGGDTSNTESDKANGEQEEALPVWLLFRSTTCIPCIEMQKTMDALQPEFQGKIKFVPVDVNDGANKELMTRFQIRYIPTTYLYDRNQKLYYQHVGALSVDEMRVKLQALLEVR